MKDGCRPANAGAALADAARANAEVGSIVAHAHEDARITHVCNIKQGAVVAARKNTGDRSPHAGVSSPCDVSMPVMFR